MKTLGEELAKFKNAKDLNRELRASYEEAKRDEKFRELVDQIPFGDDELMKYTSILEDCVTLQMVSLSYLINHENIKLNLMSKMII